LFPWGTDINTCCREILYNCQSIFPGKLHPSTSGVKVIRQQGRQIECVIITSRASSYGHLLQILRTVLNKNNNTHTHTHTLY
jgi:hypothetical protein